ncbi:hypothetical protein PR001_g2397 [Phytophthora rubi]|uniref:Helitron helicase-like domain-containing protein n=1 Tax=Phytophthora rubi TaxID=129364 RepID=A0A6A3P9V5_9STRA|nr:hypothetical protein PR001_g2397 [Phytophthora rubi]
MLGDHTLTRSAQGLQETGTHIILSSKFPGGVRYMRQQYYDSMAIVRQFGKPDLFVTVTTNPKWPEIQANLLPGQTPSDRPDIVTRVFKMKLKAILKDITKKRVFGDMQAFVYVIEFQKRGLPHAHILIILKGESKPRSSAEYDRFVCAEIPSRELHPELYETVTTCMIHGPCGKGINSSCVGEDGKCSKRFPKAFVDQTRVDGDGYPVYRRRQSGPVDPAFPHGPQMSSSVRFVSKRIRNPRRNGPKSRLEAMVVDNRWVVPYNPYLCQKYNCHINVEICSTVQSVKYLYKYVYKGQDRATVSLRPQQQRRSLAEAVDTNQDQQFSSTSTLDTYHPLKHAGRFSSTTCNRNHIMSTGYPFMKKENSWSITQLLLYFKTLWN